MTSDPMPSTTPLSDVIPLLISAAREYDRLVRAEGNLTRQLKSIARTMSADHSLLVTQEESVGDDDEQADHYSIDAQGGVVGLSRPIRNAHLSAILASPALEHARAFLRSHRRAADRRVRLLARQLPVFGWTEAIRGIADLSLGLIVAETGDLSDYQNPAKVWKRMGLAVFDGRAQRRVSGRGDVSKGRTRADATAEAIAMGFSPRRRALMHVVGENLLRLNDGEYRRVYDGRKAYEQAQRPDLKPADHHRRALRYMEKRFLLHLWQEWRRLAAEKVLSPVSHVPPVATELVHA